MQTIAILQGSDLAEFLANLGIDLAETKIDTLRIDQRGNGIAVKVNGDMWSPTLGRRADAGGY